MLNKLQTAYTKKYQTAIAFLFIISFIVFQPIFKYSEYKDIRENYHFYRAFNNYTGPIVTQI